MVQVPLTLIHGVGPAGKQFCLKNCLVQNLHWWVSKISYTCVAIWMIGNKRKNIYTLYMYGSGTIHLFSWGGTCWKAILFEKLPCTKSPLVRSEVLWFSNSKISMGMLVIWYPLVRRTSTVQVQSSFGLLEIVLGKILKHTPSSYTLQLMRCPTWKLTLLGQN